MSEDKAGVTTTRSGHAADAETLAGLLGHPKANECEDPGAAASRARSAAGSGHPLTEGVRTPTIVAAGLGLSHVLSVNPRGNTQWPGCGTSLPAQLTGGNHFLALPGGGTTR